MTKKLSPEELQKIMLGPDGIMYPIARDMQANAFRNAPEVTGEMRDGIKWFIDPVENKIIIGSDTSYSKHVEKGTVAMVKAHGKHDPKNPVTDWEAKRKKGKNPLAILPFLGSAAFQTANNLDNLVPKKLKMHIKLTVK